MFESCPKSVAAANDYERNLATPLPPRSARDSNGELQVSVIEGEVRPKRRGNADQRATGRAAAHDVGASGTNPTGDSAALWTRPAVVGPRDAGCFRGDGRHAGASTS